MAPPTSREVMTMYTSERLKECNIQVNDIPSLKKIADSVSSTDALNRIKLTLNNFRNHLIVDRGTLISDTGNRFPGSADDLTVKQAFDGTLVAGLLNEDSNWSHIYMFVILTAEICARSATDGNTDRVPWVNDMAGDALNVRVMQQFFAKKKGWDAAPDMFGVSRAEQQQRQQQEKEGTGGVLNTAATYGAALLKLALELKTSRYDL